MFCLQNHPKYAPIYLNLPSGNKLKTPQSFALQGFAAFLQCFHGGGNVILKLEKRVERYPTDRSYNEGG